MTPLPHVVDRKFKAIDESVNELRDIMFNFCKMSRRQRIIMRNRTERLSEHLDWNTLGICYQQSRVAALSKLINFFDETANNDQEIENGFDGFKSGLPGGSGGILHSFEAISRPHLLLGG